MNYLWYVFAARNPALMIIGIIAIFVIANWGK